MLKVQATRTLERVRARRDARARPARPTPATTRVERIYREARIFAIGGGTEEILSDLAARQLGF